MILIYTIEYQQINNLLWANVPNVVNHQLQDRQENQPQ